MGSALMSGRFLTNVCTAAFEEPNEMPTLYLRDPAQWPVEKWDIGSVILKRRSLFYTEPIYSPEIMQYNKWLLSPEHVDELTLDEIVEVWAHCMFLVYVGYCDKDCDPKYRHQLLLNLKDRFNEYLAMPERLQQKFWPMWSFWYGKFRAEELVEEGWWDGETY
jgi:hypothetical protein